LPSWLRPRGGSAVAVARAAAPRPFRRRLPIPAELTDAQISIPIRPAKVQILPGRRTRMWTYGGSFPGPTIRRPSGEQTQVTFTHNLPRKAGELSVHLHGGHNASADDGQPGGLTALQARSFYCDVSADLTERQAGNDLLVGPGESRTYTYNGVEDGGDERAAFQWYHDHRLERTARNVWKGLAGMWILEDDFEAGLGLPAGDRDLPLMITDRSFNSRNQLTNPFPKAGKPPFDQVTGRQILVNGAVLPFAPVTAQRHRLRLLNTSNFRSYNLHLEGVPMIQIATESGLMPKAIRRDRILLGPGERAEVIADFSGARGKRVRLVSGRRSDGEHLLGSKPYVGPVMQFRVGSEELDDATFDPGHLTELRPLPVWVADAPATPSKTWKITVGIGLRPRWLINGKTFNPAAVQAKPAAGEIVTWKLQNKTKVAHLFHLHHTDWYMLRRNGRTPPLHEQCLKETFFLDPGDTVIVAGKMSDYTGKYVVHCHMLDHEDHGLMSQFEVVDPA
jgi:spore coat protein A